MSNSTKWVIHAKCCAAHWELAIDKDGELHLVCEKCQQPSGPFAKVTAEAISSQLKLRPRTGLNCFHTRCCGDHREILVYEDGTADLVCVKCGEADPDVQVNVDLPDKVRCAVCGKGDCSEH